MKRLVPWGLALLIAAGILATSCEGFVNEEIGRGIGTPCRDDDDCQASQCLNGTCTVECSAPEDCPAPSACTDAAVCEIPLSAGFVLVGSFNQEQWSAAHELGRQAADQLSYLTTGVSDKNGLPNEVASATASFLGSGNQIIVVNRSTMLPTVRQAADANPDVDFWVAGWRRGNPPDNVTMFDGRIYQAYYLAGIAAARQIEGEAEPRLGILGSYVTPAVVAMINAYHLGARTVLDDVVTEVRWVGDWHDPSDPDLAGERVESILTKALIDGGAIIIAHTVDNHIPVATASEYGDSTTRAIGANIETACDAPPGVSEVPRCIGVVYYNWGSIYRRMFDTVHAGDSLDPEILEGIRVNPNESLVNFKVVGGTNQQAVAEEIDGVRAALASGDRRVFDGPIHSTGQCGDLDPVTMKYVCVAEGDNLGEDRLRDMCWLADGIIDEATGDPLLGFPALVPEQGDCIPEEE